MEGGGGVAGGWMDGLLEVLRSMAGAPNIHDEKCLKDNTLYGRILGQLILQQEA